MQLREALHDRQAQTQAAMATHAGLFTLREWLEDPRDEMRIDPLSRIGHPKAERQTGRFVGSDRDANRSARLGVSDSVVQEIPDDLTQAQRVRPHLAAAFVH